MKFFVFNSAKVIHCMDGAGVWCNVYCCENDRCKLIQEIMRMVSNHKVLQVRRTDSRNDLPICAPLIVDCKAVTPLVFLSCNVFS